MKRLIISLLTAVLIISFTGCGKTKEPATDQSPTSIQETQETEKEPETEPDIQLVSHENTFFNIGYNEEDGWSLTEDDIYIYDTGGYAHVRILNEEGYTEIVVTINAEQKDPYTFRKDLYNFDIDMKAYAAGEIETVDVGGQPMLYVDMENGDRFFFGRNEEAGVTYTIDATNWDDPRVPALIENITCTASGTDNAEPPWPWEGEPLSGETMSQMVGTYTVTAEFLPMNEPLVTYETFNHEVEVIDNNVYLLSDYVLREYAYEGTALAFNREIPLDEEFQMVESSNGNMVISGFMRPVIGHDGNSMLYSYDGPDRFSVAPDGSWGISWFSSGETTEKYIFQGDTLVGEPLPFNEVDIINHLNIDNKYIYVTGSPADENESGHTVFVYDHNGTLKFKLKGDPNDSIGLGSVTFVAQTANGFLAMDGNMRDVVLWSKDGTWLGAVEDGDIFGTEYPWFATGDVMNDGSIIVVMTEDRADGSAMEAIAFKISVS